MNEELYMEETTEVVKAEPEETYIPDDEEYAEEGSGVGLLLAGAAILTAVGVGVGAVVKHVRHTKPPEQEKKPGKLVKLATGFLEKRGFSVTKTEEEPPVIEAEAADVIIEDSVTFEMTETEVTE